MMGLVVMMGLYLFAFSFGSRRMALVDVTTATSSRGMGVFGVVVRFRLVLLDDLEMALVVG